MEDSRNPETAVPFSCSVPVPRQVHGRFGRLLFDEADELFGQSRHTPVFRPHQEYLECQVRLERAPAQTLSGIGQCRNQVDNCDADATGNEVACGESCERIDAPRRGDMRGIERPLDGQSPVIEIRKRDQCFIFQMIRTNQRLVGKRMLFGKHANEWNPHQQLAQDGRVVSIKQPDAEIDAARSDPFGNPPRTAHRQRHRDPVMFGEELCHDVRQPAVRDEWHRRQQDFAVAVVFEIICKARQMV